MENFYDRLQKAHHLIKNEATGTRSQFAKKLGISETALWRTLKEFKNRNIPVKFHRRGETYYYDIAENEEVKLIWIFELVKKQDM
ncbi:MAG: HTH domain-containing protein [Bacteroidota bacterium]